MVAFALEPVARDKMDQAMNREDIPPIRFSSETIYFEQAEGIFDLNVTGRRLAGVEKVAWDDLSLEAGHHREKGPGQGALRLDLVEGNGPGRCDGVGYIGTVPTMVLECLVKELHERLAQEIKVLGNRNASGLNIGGGLR